MEAEVREIEDIERSLTTVDLKMQVFVCQGMCVASIDDSNSVWKAARNQGPQLPNNNKNQILLTADKQVDRAHIAHW